MFFLCFLFVYLHFDGFLFEEKTKNIYKQTMIADVFNENCCLTYAVRLDKQIQYSNCWYWGCAISSLEGIQRLKKLKVVLIPTLDVIEKENIYN